ncbi:MAG: hypothetical protein IPG45_18745 [Deltaproteobacteria bacterium]|jgi:hypothetical protein|nr:hypothetical protein [Deltaproteobacteria bacterium]
MKTIMPLTLFAAFAAFDLSPASAADLAPVEARAELELPLATPEGRDRLVLSAKGPGEGRQALGAYLTADLILPTLDLRWAYGLTDRLTLQVRGASGFGFGIYQAALGLRYTFLDVGALALAAEVSTRALLFVAPGELGGTAGVDPRLLVSVGPDDLQVTLTAGAQYWAKGGLEPGLPLLYHASLGLEVAAVTAASATIQLGILYDTTSANLPVIPTLLVGGSL